MANTIIKLDCIDQNLIVAESPVISSGGANSTSIEVNFSTEWGGLGKSAVFFTDKNKTVYEIVLVNDACVVPAEVLTDTGYLFIGVRGVGADGIVKPSSMIKYKISKGAPVGDGTAVEPTSTVYQQLLTAYGKTTSDLNAAIATEKAERKSEVAVERARIDAFVGLAEGSTTGDAELLDIRVGADGATYDSAGTAVREQINGLHNAMTDEMNSAYDGQKITVPQLFDGFTRYASGEISNDSFDGYYKRTDYVYVPSRAYEIEHDFVNNDSGVDGVSFYDGAKQYISGHKSNGAITNIPDGTKYIVFSNYDNTRTHSPKTIVFHCRRATETKNNVGKLVTFGDSHVSRGLWQKKVLDACGVSNHVNLGIGGSTVAVNSGSSVLPFVDNERISAIQNEDPNTVIIIGGTNDVHLETPLGTIDELTKTTENKDKNNFYGAYGYLIETLLTWKPTLQIIVCTTPQGYYDNIHPVKYSEVSQAIREIANYYSLPVADVFADCGINKINLATYSDDLIHYNEAGNERVASLIVNTINKSYLTNV